MDKTNWESTQHETETGGSPADCGGAKAALDLQAALARRIAEGEGAANLIEALARSMTCAAVLEDAGLTLSDAWLEELPTVKERLAPLVSVRTSPAFKSVRDIAQMARTPVRLADDFGGRLPHGSILIARQRRGE
jgi:hypothetical protein